MSRLSVNVNKIATLRNARGGNNPNLIEVVKDCEKFGAEGITIHPRPDERHIRYQDALDLKKVVQTEFNIEGYPSKKFIDLIRETKPDQVTLVPDPPNALTSDSGWDLETNLVSLKEFIQKLKPHVGRVAIFMNAEKNALLRVKETGTDRVELYTGSYAANYESDPGSAILPFQKAAKYIHEMEIGLNAGHDLDLKNLAFFRTGIPNLLEVSIGHALIADSLYYGLENTIQLYLKRLGR